MGAAPQELARLPPAWFDRLLGLLVCALLGLALAGMPLAIAGAFRPALVLPASALVALALLRLRGPPAPRPASRPATLAAIFVLVSGVAIGAVNARYSAEHLIVDRDPGVYATTGLWLAESGELTVDGRPEIFGSHPDLSTNGGGYYPTESPGELDPQFLHLLPVVIATGDWLGGSRLALKVNALIGVLALFALFSLACRVMRPWLAAAVTLALGVGLPEVYFARDSYSEILSQLFLLAGLGALWDARQRRESRRAALIAGLLLGATCLTRIDAFLVVISLAVYASVVLFAAEGLPAAERTRDRRWVAALIAGVAVPATIGLLDGLLHSPGYLRDLRPELVAIAAGVGLAVVGGALALVARRRFTALRPALARARRPLATVAAVAILVVGVFGLALRPAVESATVQHSQGAAMRIEAVQRVQGDPVDGSRTYAELTLRWLGWYLGPLAVLAGIAGVAFATRRALLGRAPELVLALLVFAVPAALYLWRPHIDPYQLWPMRRFLPVVIPLVLLFAGWGLDRLWSHASASGVPGRWTAAGRVAVVAVAAALVAVPGAQLAGLATMEEQGGVLPALRSVCSGVGADAAVLLRGDPGLTFAYLPGLQVVCDVPVARADGPLSGADLDEIAAGVRSTGRRLVVVATDPQSLGAHRSGGEPTPLVNHPFEQLEPTLTQRPREMVAAAFTLYAAPGCRRRRPPPPAVPGPARRGPGIRPAHRAPHPPPNGRCARAPR